MGQIKKGEKKWILKEIETGNIYYLSISVNEDFPEVRMHEFLMAMGVCDEYTLPRTNGPIDYHKMAEDIMQKGEFEAWIPENRLPTLKSSWVASPETTKATVMNQNVNTFVAPPYTLTVEGILSLDDTILNEILSKVSPEKITKLKDILNGIS